MNRVIQLMSYSIKTFGLSDIGLVRQNNEDAWEILPHLNLCILADGMGGHQAGEVASHQTVKTLSEKMNEKTRADYDQMPIRVVEDYLRQAIIHANLHVFKMARTDFGLRGMGTTLCALFFHPKGVIVAHVGDSRVYRLHDGILELLTKDHSLFCELVDQKQIIHDQTNEFLYGNIITKAIGTEPSVEPTIKNTKLDPEDLYLMCSDGLSDLLNIKEINDILNTSSSLEEASTSLITNANKRGGRDNITVILAKITS